MADNPLPRRPLGGTNLEVTPVGFGTSPLGSMPETYGHAVGQDQALETLAAMVSSPVNLIDTSRNYGEGRAEERVGLAFGGSKPAGVVLSTKLDREAGSGRFDRDQARRSLEESLTALGLDRVDLLHLHDPEHSRSLDEITEAGGAIDELFRMRDEGLADAVGLAMGRLDIMEPLVANHDFDVILNHNRFSLLNRSADRLFNAAHERGIGILNAAPYAGGILAKGSTGHSMVTYQEADEAALAPIRRLEAICDAHQVPLGALALQFSMRDPRIASTIIGVSRPERVDQTLTWATLEIPAEAWDAVDQVGYGTDDPEAGRDSIPG